MTVLVAGDLVTLSNSFRVDSVLTDPTTISLAVTDPLGATTTYTHAAGTVTKAATGVYTKDVTCSTAGTWQYVWTGTGTAADVTDGTFRVWTANPTTNYATVQDFKDWKGITDTTDDWRIRIAVASASRAVDNFTHRKFSLDTTATARSYRASVGDVVNVDDIGTATGLIVATDDDDDGVAETAWTVATDYLLEPANALAVGRPLTAIGAVGTRWFPTSGRRARVSITARWGWPSPPEDVFQATLILANRLFLRKDAPHGVAGFNDFGVIRIAANDPDIAPLIGHYKLYAIA